MNKKFTIKIATIFGLVLALMIPLSMIEGVVSERSMYRDEVKADIAQSWTGTQKFLGPVLIVPYVEKYAKKEWDKNLKAYKQNTYFRHKQIYLLPEQLRIRGEITTEQRRRGLYSIPVYASELLVEGGFTNQQLVALWKKKGNDISWKRPYVSMLVSDIRGISEQPKLSWARGEYEFTSGSGMDNWDNGMHASIPKMQVSAHKPYHFSFRVNLKGMEKIEFAPVGRSTDVSIKANWPHPSFIGRYLPSQRTIHDAGFEASWKMSSFSSDMPRLIKACQANECNDFIDNTFGVALINSVDIYHKTERSVKYAVLFISLTFIIFFLFEIMKDLRLHPLQYLLVGLSLTFFYQLLVSLSEHMAFLSAYMIAALSNVVVIGTYISEVLKSRQRALGFSAMLLLLYAMLYAILISEDNALLMGSLLFFTILSLVMLVTRKLDWYQVTDKLANQAVVKKE
ncbi:MAG: cell envelope integrity protein CreD [Gammaproteobacteria bacterium]|nr:cell envelope integrity protein CreD [Gammaproteobacteria bacterium]